MWMWIVVGILGYAGFLTLVVGICRAAKTNDLADRAVFEEWLRARYPGSGEHRPAA